MGPSSVLLWRIRERLDEVLKVRLAMFPPAVRQLAVNLLAIRTH
jgi:hypothetical protein